MRIDLHTHSLASDGTDTPTQLVRNAAAQGLSVVALTDHDTFDGLEEARLAAERAGVGFLGGLEMSAELHGRSVHLLGYGCDPASRPLAEELIRLREHRAERLPAMLARLAAAGYPLTLDEVWEQSAGASVGRPHLADALVARGYVATRDEAFARLLGEGLPGYVHRYSTPLVEGIRLVHAAGGVAVIAHPWARGRRADLTVDVLHELVDAHRLDGIEVDHPDHDDDARAGLRRVAERLGLLATGSSDHHGLGKTRNPLGAATTRAEVYEEILARVGARSGTPTP